VTIASRGSKLALWQSRHIKALLEKTHNIEVDLKIIKTTGDKILDVPLAKICGKGLFTKEIEEAMLNGEAQIAVHSLKDFPIDFPKDLALSAITEREDVRDSMLSEKYSSLDELPEGAVVGTTSFRRKMQLLKHRPDLTIKDLRGNVDTRINKLKNGEFDAIILAQAGINRLEINDSVKYIVPIEREVMVPSMGQASLAIETIKDEKIVELVSVLNNEKAYIETYIEREFIEILEGGCQVPIGINAELLENGKIRVMAILGKTDASEMLEEEALIERDEYIGFGKKLALQMIEKGAKTILEL
jgi:hydroxymethylbilane synthase